jgi:60 kDa SS-A/Ro ribonucleoprotein
LEDSFFASFDNVTPAGTNHLLALDVSGSMGWSKLNNTNISARDAAACMAMVTHRTEPNTEIVAFCDKMVPFSISKRDGLAHVSSDMSNLSFGRTDCAQPMIYAMEHKLNVDTFVIYTDNETWYGAIHPSQALHHYRQRTGNNAKLIVVGMTATQFSIADPNDQGMLDVVGFDASCPAVMADFSRGQI